MKGKQFQVIENPADTPEETARPLTVALNRFEDVLADHRENDIAEPPSTQLSYLRAAGSAPAEVIWSWEKFALFYAAKPMPAA